MYTEPVDYFPEELRKKYKLGEFAEDEEDEGGESANKTEGESSTATSTSTADKTAEKK